MSATLVSFLYNLIKIIRKYILFKSKKLLIFDLDGTLIDSAPDLANSLNFMLKELNKEEYQLKKIREWIGNGAKTLVKRALLNKKDIENEMIDDELLDKALEIFLDHYKKNGSLKTKAYPDVQEILKKLSKRYKLAIATNKPDEFVKPILKKLSLDSYFDFIIGSCDKVKNKPDPSMLMYITKKLNIDKKDTLMIGDSLNDILSAKNANIDSILVSYGYSNSEDFIELEPNLTINSFKKLEEILL